jgi:hypothetical protein
MLEVVGIRNCLSKNKCCTDLLKSTCIRVDEASCMNARMTPSSTRMPMAQPTMLSKKNHQRLESSFTIPVVHPPVPF